MILCEKISVVIPCKNEGKNVLKTIQSIPSGVSIILSDSSTDSTLNHIPSHVKITQGGLPSCARNNGAKLVNTPYVLFLDADMDISNVNLEKMISDVIKEDYQLVTTKIRVNTWRNIFYETFYIIQKIISKKTPFAVGGFMLFKLEEFYKLGQFNEEDKFAEDFHLSMKVNPNKFKIYKDVAITSDRRLKNKGVFYILFLMLKCWFNKDNNDFYKKDHNYWK